MFVEARIMINLHQNISPGMLDQLTQECHVSVNSMGALPLHDRWTFQTSSSVFTFHMLVEDPPNRLHVLERISEAAPVVGPSARPGYQRAHELYHAAELKIDILFRGPPSHVAVAYLPDAAYSLARPYLRTNPLMDGVGAAQSNSRIVLGGKDPQHAAVGPLRVPQPRPYYSLPSMPALPPAVPGATTPSMILPPLSTSNICMSPPQHETGQRPYAVNPNPLVAAVTTCLRLRLPSHTPVILQMSPGQSSIPRQAGSRPTDTGAAALTPLRDTLYVHPHA